MTQDQVIEVGKALLPYLRADLTHAELGMASHDAAAALSRTGGRGELVKRAAMIERERCLKIIDDLRISEAGNFKDPKCQGQRGQDRSDALYDAYQAVKNGMGE